MSGLFEEYGIDPDEVPDAPSYDIADGIYEFEVSNAFDWVSDDEDRSAFVIEYALGDEGKTKSEWFNLPEDASAPTEAEMKKLGFLKQRLLSLGVPRESLATVEKEDLIGITGTLQLKTSRAKNGSDYQNVRNVTVEEAEEEAPAAKAPVAKAPAKKGKPQAVANTKPNPFAKKAAQG